MNKLKIVTISFLFVSCCTVKAQMPSPGSNIINNTLGKFTGTWQWVSGTDTVKIFLKKDNVLFFNSYHADRIIGLHLYKKGNTIIESSYNYTNTVRSDKYSTILAGNDSGNNILTGTLKDLKKNKLLNITLTLNAQQTELQWQTNNREGLKIGPYDYGYTLPRTITLKKL
ncbi:MAG: hypothetical protein IPJ81_04685 [Chitinophagaceae bacterium]|nr:hypothetical protein [Chitinophagaceae bacterium]